MENTSGALKPALCETGSCSISLRIQGQRQWELRLQRRLHRHRHKQQHWQEQQQPVRFAHHLPMGRCLLRLLPTMPLFLSLLLCIATALHTLDLAAAATAGTVGAAAVGSRSSYPARLLTSVKRGVRGKEGHSQTRGRGTGGRGKEEEPAVMTYTIFTPALIRAFREFSRGNAALLRQLAPHLFKQTQAQKSLPGGVVQSISRAVTTNAGGVRRPAPRGPPPPSPPPPSNPNGGLAPPMTYHGGHIMVGPRPITVHLIWYGTWSPASKRTIRAFIRSFSPPGVPVEGPVGRIPSGTVAKWWSVTSVYPGKGGREVARRLRLGREYTFWKPLYGKELNLTTTRSMVRRTLKTRGGTLPVDDNGIYAVLSGPEIRQKDFCESMCGFHSYLAPPATRPPNGGAGKLVAFAWVGDPTLQCPGFCGFPFARPPFVPPQFATVVKPPNGRLGTDAVIEVLSHEMAGIATNPSNLGWYGGNRFIPNEISDVCIGIFGPGAYPGFPGTVRYTPRSNRAYNVDGVAGRKFLLPWLWQRKIGACAQQVS